MRSVLRGVIEIKSTNDEYKGSKHHHQYGTKIKNKNTQRHQSIIKWHPKHFIHLNELSWLKRHTDTHVYHFFYIHIAFQCNKSPAKQNKKRKKKYVPFLATIDTEKFDQFSGLMPQTYEAIEPEFIDLFNSKRKR